MTTSTNSTPSNTDSTKQLPDPTKKSDPAPAPAVDDLGYEIVPPAKEEGVTPEDKKEDVDPPKDDEEVKEPVSGYGKEPAVEEKPEDKKEDKKEDVDPAELTEEQKAQKELDDVVKALGDGYDQKKISDFAKTHKLTKDQLKAYVEMVKAEDAQAAKNQAEAIKAQRAGWEKELRDDTEFGGANFIANVAKAEKVLEKHFPNLKKMLTDKKGMLPPYIMKDLLNVHKVLNPTTKFEGGEPPAPPKEEKHFLDEMYG